MNQICVHIIRSDEKHIIWELQNMKEYQNIIKTKIIVINYILQSIPVHDKPIISTIPNIIPSHSFNILHICQLRIWWRSILPYISISVKNSISDGNHGIVIITINTIDCLKTIRISTIALNKRVPSILRIMKHCTVYIAP